MTSIHMGFGVQSLRQLIEEGTLKPHVLVVDGKELRTKGEALAHLADLIANGKTTISSCPTPDSKGRCPRHDKEG